MKTLLLLALLAFQTISYGQSMNGWTFYTGADYGLPDNRFLRVFEDSKGNFWIGTYNGVVKVQGPYKIIYNTGNSGLPSNTISKIAEDSKGNMWFGSGGGVTKFDGVTWANLTTGNSSLPSNEVTKVSIDYKDRVWVTTIAGVLVIDGATQTVYNSGNSIIPVGPQLKDLVTRATFDSKKNTWLSTQAGVVKITDAGVWSLLNTKNSGIRCDTVGSILEDKDGNYWFGTQRGISKFDGTNWTYYNKSNSGLPADYVWDILQDSYGSMWISVFSSSYPYSPPLARFSNGTWTTFNQGCFSFGSSIVGITEDSDSKLWFAVSNGLVKYDPLQGSVGLTHSAPKDEFSIYPNPVVGKVRIQTNGNKTVSWIAVTDMQGRCLVKTYNPIDNQVDISNLAKGLYFIEFEVDKNLCMKKIVKR